MSQNKSGRDPLVNGESNHSTRVPKSTNQDHDPRSPIGKIREQCMARGSSGIKGLSRLFRRADDDGDRSINDHELFKLISEYGITGLKKGDMNSIIAIVDADGSGTINFDEFLQMLRPPMSAARQRVIEQAFQKLDRTCDGIITVEDLKGVYNVKKNPKYLNGEWTEEQCLGKFLDNFDSKEKDGKVTKEEFIMYYDKVSMSIDQDSVFDLMMRNSWKLQ